MQNAAVGRAGRDMPSLHALSHGRDFHASWAYHGAEGNLFCLQGEEEEEDEYDVLPQSKGAGTPQATTPKEVASPTRGPQRTSYAGNARPPSAGPGGGGGGILGNRGGHGECTSDGARRVGR